MGMKLDDRGRDNIANRVNKRVQKIVSEMGTSSKEYQKFRDLAGKTLGMKLVERDVVSKRYKLNETTGKYEIVKEKTKMVILSRSKKHPGFTDYNLVTLDQEIRTVEEAQRAATKGHTKEELLEDWKLRNENASKLPTDKQLYADAAILQASLSDLIEEEFHDNEDLIYEIMMENGWSSLKDASNNEDIYRAIQKTKQRNSGDALKQMLSKMSDNEDTTNENSDSWTWKQAYYKSGIGTTAGALRYKSEQEAATTGRARFKARRK